MAIDRNTYFTSAHNQGGEWVEKVSIMLWPAPRPPGWDHLVKKHRNVFSAGKKSAAGLHTTNKFIIICSNTSANVFVALQQVSAARLHATCTCPSPPGHNNPSLVGLSLKPWSSFGLCLPQCFLLACMCLSDQRRCLAASQEGICVAEGVWGGREVV